MTILQTMLSAVLLVSGALEPECRIVVLMCLLEPREYM